MCGRMWRRTSTNNRMYNGCNGQVSLYFPPKTMWRALYCATFAAMTLQVLLA